MLDVCLLGTGGMVPLPNRWLTSLWVRYEGKGLLIDCGEGTQITMRELGWSFKDVDHILFTHFHGDHISGLPGLLLSIGNCGRTEPVTLIGPRGLRRICEGLLLIAPELPFDLEYRELGREDLGVPMKLGELSVTAFAADHGVPCYGYALEAARLPKFDPERARAAGVPLCYWNPLQHGETVTAEDGTVYTPDLVLGAARKGLKLSYCTDSRPKKTIVEGVRGSDLFICEGMYGEPEKQEKAKEHKHMSFREAAEMAAEAGVGELWLTHFSPAEPNPKAYLSEATAIFPNSFCGKDRKTVTLRFSDEEVPAEDADAPAETPGTAVQEDN